MQFRTVLFQLSHSDRWLLIKALFILSLVRLGLYRLPLATLRQALQHFVGSGSKDSNRPQLSIYKIIWAVTCASHYMPQVKCLARALTTQVLLKQQGYVTQLKIGMAKSAGGEFQAHAWVEHRGRVVMGGIGNSVKRYKVMPLEEFETLEKSVSFVS